VKVGDIARMNRGQYKGSYVYIESISDDRSWVKVFGYEYGVRWQRWIMADGITIV
jgi:hypothetical protein